MAKKTQQQETGPDDAILPEAAPAAESGTVPLVTGADHSEPEERITMVVVRGNTVRHNGHNYMENQTIRLHPADARRLFGLNVVVSLDTLRQQALTPAAPAVSVSGEE